jgi:hypothetical protein
MMRRSIISMAMVTAGVLVSASTGFAGHWATRNANAPERSAQIHLAAYLSEAGTPHQAQMRQCIQNCLECHSRCLETVMHCQQMGGKHAEPAHLRLLQDCAEICQTSANFLLRSSTFHSRVCGVCADVCAQCARSCERFPDDPQMKACAASARRSAQSCRVMAGMGA